MAFVNFSHNLLFRLKAEIPEPGPDSVIQGIPVSLSSNNLTIAYVSSL
jgi:hypothetical protein